MKNLSLILLVLGLVFSVFYVQAAWGPGFSTIEYNPKIRGSLISIGGSTDNIFVTTHFIGYVFFLAFGLLNIGRARKVGMHRGLWLFTALNLFGLIIELSAWLQMYRGAFSGYHFRIGVAMILLGLWLQDKIYNKQQTGTNGQVPPDGSEKT
ncbi:MAG: hypothetical protein EOP49_06535 [Sphingobacteriales bacterium]|nr:MAG: hypothetical protein EOP49_06535 [Sphingobacteriales bacterium]